MTKIEQLRNSLAADAYIENYLIASEIEELLDLVEMQHEALKELEQHLPCGVGIAALAAFEEWNKP